MDARPVPAPPSHRRRRCLRNVSRSRTSRPRSTRRRVSRHALPRPESGPPAGGPPRRPGSSRPPELGAARAKPTGNFFQQLRQQVNWAWVRRALVLGAAVMVILPVVTFAMAYFIVDIPKPGDIRTAPRGSRTISASGPASRGGDLARRATTQARRFGAEMLLTSEVAAMEVCGSARVVRMMDGTELSAHVVLVTTGVAYRRLDAPGVDSFTGSGVYYGAAATEGQACKDEDVYIVGGANSAGQAAVYFARTARSVTIVVRGDSLERSMSHYLIQQIASLPNVSVRTCSEVVGAGGSDHLERLRIADRVAGTEDEVEASWLFVFIGAAPCTDWLGKEVVRDEAGFLLTGPDLVVEGQLPADWPLERHPYFPRDERARRVRSRRRAGPVGEAGGVCRRRGRHGSHARAPLLGVAVTADATALKGELRRCFLFESLTDEQLDWLAGHGVVETHNAGVSVYGQGDPAESFYVLLDGEIELVQHFDGADVVLTTATQPGSYAGATRAFIGSSTDESYPSNLRTVTQSRLFKLAAEDFAFVLKTWFPMAVHLLDGLFLGLTNAEALVGQRDKLVALGALSAGLAHELNNPAAAEVRAADALSGRLLDARKAMLRLAPGVDKDELPALLDLLTEAVDRTSGGARAINIGSGRPGGRLRRTARGCGRERSLGVGAHARRRERRRGLARPGRHVRRSGRR